MDALAIDKPRILERIKEIHRRLKFLEEIKKVSLKNFLVDHRISSSAERDLEIAIQACLDIADHLIAKLGLEIPKKDRKEVFAVLAKEKILPENLVSNLQKMAGQRNLLIHEYLEIEREKIYETINHNLGDIVEFIKNIQKWLDSRSGRE